MRKVLKILHTLAACGLIGGLGCYMILLVFSPQDNPAAYADLRQSIAAISNYVLLPSLAIGLVSGLLSMAVHKPFQNQRWALFKAAVGILMFKGVLTVVGAIANQAAIVAQKVADGEPAIGVLDAALSHEWGTLTIVMALSVANVVLGIWRPSLARRSKSHAHRISEAATATDAVARKRERAAFLRT